MQVHSKQQERLYKSSLDLLVSVALEKCREGQRMIAVHRKFSSRPPKDSLYMDNSSHRYGAGFQFSFVNETMIRILVTAPPSN